jgi:nitrile hydratase beta subunit
MNGPHDIGGLQGFGPVRPESDEPVFHDEWEGRTCGLQLTLAALGVHVTDEFRHAQEQMPYGEYYAKSYFERWLWTVEKLLHDKGVVSHDELEARVAAIASGEHPAGRVRTVEDPAVATRMRAKLRDPRADPRVQADAPARFAAGDRVRTRNVHIREHLRLPGYAKRHSGWIHAYRGAFHDPRWLADGAQRRPAHLYAVGFKAGELWGEVAERPDDNVYIETFEQYLEPLAGSHQETT